MSLRLDFLRKARFSEAVFRVLGCLGRWLLRFAEPSGDAISVRNKTTRMCSAQRRRADYQLSSTPCRASRCRRAQPLNAPCRQRPFRPVPVGAYVRHTMSPSSSPVRLWLTSGCMLRPTPHRDFFLPLSLLATSDPQRISGRLECGYKVVQPVRRHHSCTARRPVHQLPPSFLTMFIVRCSLSCTFALTSVLHVLHLPRSPRLVP